MVPSSVVTILQGIAREPMPAVTMTNTELLINGFLYLGTVNAFLADRLACPAVHFKTRRSIYSKAVLQFIAPDSKTCNLLTEPGS